MTSKIERLEAMEIVGNAYHDQDLFRLAHEILMDDAEPVAIWGRALKAIDRAMGCDSEWEGLGDEGIRHAVADYRHYAAGMEGRCDD
jgi:hypothetical protein